MSEQQKEETAKQVSFWTGFSAAIASGLSQAGVIGGRAGQLASSVLQSISNYFASRQ